MSKSMYLAAAALSTVLVAASGAHAGLSANGISLNGVTPNGLSSNGIATGAFPVKAAILQDGSVVVVK